MTQNQKLQTQRMYAPHYYVDGQTPAMELVTLYNLPQKQNIAEAD